MTIRLTAQTIIDLYRAVEEWRHRHDHLDALMCGRSGIISLRLADGKLEYYCDVYYAPLPLEV